jgi:sugar porter (SP) family MFS transporter
MPLLRTTSGHRSIKQSQTNSVATNRDVEDITKTSLSSSSITMYLLYAIFIATLGPFQFGYHLGELNAPQKVITCNYTASKTNSTAFLPQCISMDDPQWGLVQSIFTIGGLTGAILAGANPTKYGRLFGMRLLTTALLLGSLAEATATSIIRLTFGRFLSGIGAGAATVVCPMFVAEISPWEKRGLFGSFTQVMVNTGILVSQVLGYFLSYGNHWRLILIFPGCLSLLTLVALSCLSEAPQWLVANGQIQDAKVALRRLRGTDADLKAELERGNILNHDEETPLLAPVTNSSPRKPASASFLDVIVLAKYRRAVIAVVAIFAAQQLTGVNSVVMYSVTILQSTLPTGAALVTMTLSGINVLISLLCSPLADRIGRKPCLLLSISGMGTSSILLAIALSQNIVTFAVLSLMLFVCSFGVGLGPVPFMLPSELVRSEASGATSSWGLASSWISAFCVAQFFPIVNDALPKGQVYWIFAGIALVLGTFIAWWLPESKGRHDPEQIWQ